MTTYSAHKIVVIIPTRNRPAVLDMAISSVQVQTRQPDLLIIVGEGDSDFSGLDHDHLETTGLPMLLLINERTKNLSGALNTALEILLELEFEPDRTYVAVLDDDDTWDKNYLHKCLSSASDDGADWIISGIKRYENKSTNGVSLSIPERLDASAFLVGNPHVQGSNLFVKLSTLLRAGCFDENLVSTTDRDLGVRLMNLCTVRIAFVQEHLVHHNAYNLDRLSTPGSETKRNGLSEFYRKYNPIMSREERDKFLQRAYSVFNCELFDIHPVIGESS